MQRTVACTLVLLFGSVTALLPEPAVTAEDLPRFPPVEPAEALSTIRIKAGFRVELVAAEPLVIDPVALSFDENGRMYVVEMTDYPERRKERLGRIRLIEDTNNDGRFDTSTVFADTLPWPTAVICSGGGVFVGATPDIVFLKDTTGDGRADFKETVFTGFGTGRDRLNVQTLLNSFNWTLDNRVHGATGPTGGTIRSLRHPELAPLPLGRSDFSFDPRTLLMRLENGGGQHGLSFNDTGRKFVTSNSHHIRSFMYDGHYAGRNPHYAMPGPLVDIPVDGPAAEVFRISPDEPWRIIRTKWRVAGVVPGIIEGGGRVSGYFTGATGVTIYRGHAWPGGFVGEAFVGDSGGNLVHRKQIRRDGVGVLAERPPDEQEVEFMASTDTWFRPVQFANAPDGALYVLDMYREIIEHPWSLPEPIKKHLDLDSGNDRGRIYRIVPEDFEQPAPVRLGQASTEQLAGTLEHPNGWHRDTAARLIYERGDQTAVPHLNRLAQESKSPLGRLHALYALDGLGALGEAHVLRALGDPDHSIREQGIRLEEKFLDDGSPSEKLWNKLQSLASDPDINVRYQLAFTLGEIRHPERLAAMAEIVRHDLDSRWTQSAIFSSLAEGAGELFGLMADDADLRNTASGRQFFNQLVQLIGRRNEEIARVFDIIGELQEPAVQFAVLRALGEGLQRAGSSLQKAGHDQQVQAILANARTAASGDSSDTEAARLEAIGLLGLTAFAESGPLLLDRLTPAESQPVQLAALNTLGRFTGPEMAGGIISRWENLTPRLRAEAVTLLLARPERAAILLGAIETGTVRPQELSSTQTGFLRSHRDPDLRESANRILGAQTVSSRQDLLDIFEPALSLKGDVSNGRRIFEERCASCHRFGGKGHALGPDTETFRSMSRDQLLLHIIDPNAEVPPNYLTYFVETTGGETHIGLIANETPVSLTLRQAFGTEHVVLRSEIRRMQSQNESLMPEGLEEGLSLEQMAALLEFITSGNEL